MYNHWIQQRLDTFNRVSHFDVFESVKRKLKYKRQCQHNGADWGPCIRNIAEHFTTSIVTNKTSFGQHWKYIVIHLKMKKTRTKVLLDPKSRFEYFFYQIEKIQSDMRTKMAFGQQTGLTRLTKLTSCFTILEI